MGPHLARLCPHLIQIVSTSVLLEFASNHRRIRPALYLASHQNAFAGLAAVQIVHGNVTLKTREGHNNEMASCRKDTSRPRGPRARWDAGDRASPCRERTGPVYFARCRCPRAARVERVLRGINARMRHDATASGPPRLDE